LGITGFSLPSFALNRQQVPMGARPIGLGGAYVAVSNDANAIYWNPAGLADLSTGQLTSTYTDNRFGAGIENLNLALAFPFWRHSMLGFNFYTYGYDDKELVFQDGRLYASLAVALYGGLSVGISFKSIFQQMDWDGVKQGESTGDGIDVGLMYNYNERLRLGVVWEDLTDSEVKYSGLDHEDIYLPQLMHYGASYTLFNSRSWYGVRLSDPLVTLEWSDYVAMGGEVYLFDVLGLRAGLRLERHNDEAPTQAFGTSLKLPFRLIQPFEMIRVDYTYESPPTLPGTHFLSLTLSGIPASIRIRNMHITDVYASQYANNQPVAMLELENEANETIECIIETQVPINLDGTMMVPYISQERKSIEPRRVTSEVVKVPLPEDVIQLEADRKQPVQITISYANQSYLPTTYETEFTIYRRGKCLWESEERLAHFITPTHEWINSYVQLILSDDLIIDLPENIITAMQIYCTLQATGLAYQPDPEIPYRHAKVLQRNIVKYPLELLSESPPTGDFDDITTLVVTLLENHQINTAILAFPDELLVMFDSGVPSDRKLQEIPPYLVTRFEFIERDNHLWIPLALRKIDQDGFFEAWTTGLELYRQNPDILFTKDARAKYFAVKFTPPQRPRPPTKNRIRRVLSTDIALYDSWRHTYLNAQKEERKAKAFEQYYQTALEKLTDNDWEGSIDALENALNLRPNAEEVRAKLVTAWTSLGDAHVIDGDWEAAIHAFETAKTYASAEVKPVLEQRAQNARNWIRYQESYTNARSAFQQGNMPEALRLIQQALDYQNTPEARQLRDDIQDQIKKMAE